MIVMYDQIIKLLIEQKAVKATKFISHNSIIRVVRTRYGKKFSPGNIQLTITVGKPNYLERDFIKLCKKSNESFPVKNVQLKFLPKVKKLVKKK